MRSSLAKFIGLKIDKMTAKSKKKWQAKARRNGRNHAYQGGSLPSDDELKKRYGEFSRSYIEGFLSAYRPEMQAPRREVYMQKCADYHSRRPKRRAKKRTSVSNEAKHSSVSAVSDSEQSSNHNADRQSAINQVPKLSEIAVATSDIDSIDFSMFSILREEPNNTLSEFLKDFEAPEADLSQNQSFLVQYNAISAEYLPFILDQDLSPFYSDNADPEIEAHSLFSL